jgi:hypothetical protein
MPDQLHLPLTGGCQCGAVRYEVRALPDDPHVCHCRMCQKAFGGLFAALASVPVAALVVTRGRPGVFRSSVVVERGFCRDCGTPLFFRYVDMAHACFALATLDVPAAVAPARAYGVEGRLPWVAGLDALPASVTEGDIPAERLAELASRQHPDHETSTWPPPA